MSETVEEVKQIREWQSARLSLREIAKKSKVRNSHR
jgi:hypothetical protein